MSREAAVVMVEPWYRESHRAFVDGYRQFSRFSVEVVHLKDDSWQGHMRYGAIALGEALNRLDVEPAALLLSDYVNLPALRSFCPDWCRVPWVLLFHEDQLTYPARPGLAPHPEFGAINVLSALAADACVFVTHSAKDAFFDAILQEAFAYAEGVVHLLSERSFICPVGCDFSAIDSAREQSVAGDPKRPLHILWPHRHDHDKNPGDFFRTVAELADEGLDFRVSILGMECLDSTVLLEETVRRLKNRLVHRGFLQGAAYACALTQADVVVSCAFQETQGLAVIEAVRAGCRPLLPRRLSYPEIFGGFSATLFYENRIHMKNVLRDAIGNPVRAREFQSLAPQMNRYSWQNAAPRMDQVIDSVCRVYRSDIG